MKKKRIQHNYTSELDLKSMLIRIKNWKGGKGFSEHKNKTINKYINWYVKINHKKYPRHSPMIHKKLLVKNKIKQRVIELSEITNIDKKTYEHFGDTILLMIRHILTKPNFSGYTYKIEFYSDAVYKILKYLHNFNHDLISKRSGVKVNAFAYISQIIHNSIVFVINSKKREQERIKERISNEIIDKHLNIHDNRREFKSTINSKLEFNQELPKEFKLDLKTSTLYQEIEKIQIKEKGKIVIYYPSSYKISMDEYNKLKPLLKNISIVRY